ncbi:hypothetical protein DENSPDRAFT_885838 [Dentipellis sp. KUC8613]|nr:hypothetical protein DENSPDRAFT_885838 [Dentipellis sp. KUC8613]
MLPLARRAVSVPNDAVCAPPRPASTPRHAVFGPCEGALTPHPAVCVPRCALFAHHGVPRTVLTPCRVLRAPWGRLHPARPSLSPATPSAPRCAICAPPRHLRPAPPSLRIMGLSCTLPRRLRAPPRPLNAPGRLCAPPSSRPAITHLRALSRTLALPPHTRVIATCPVPPLPTLYLHHPLRTGIMPLCTTMPISTAVTRHYAPPRHRHASGTPVPTPRSSAPPSYGPATPFPLVLQSRAPMAPFRGLWPCATLAHLRAAAPRPLPALAHPRTAATPAHIAATRSSGAVFVRCTVAAVTRPLVALTRRRPAPMHLRPAVTHSSSAALALTPRTSSVPSCTIVLQSRTPTAPLRDLLPCAALARLHAAASPALAGLSRARAAATHALVAVTRSHHRAPWLRCFVARDPAPASCACCPHALPRHRHAPPRRRHAPSWVQSRGLSCRAALRAATMRPNGAVLRPCNGASHPTTPLLSLLLAARSPPSRSPAPAVAPPLAVMLPSRTLLPRILSRAITRPPSHMVALPPALPPWPPARRALLPPATLTFLVPPLHRGRLKLLSRMHAVSPLVPVSPRHPIAAPSRLIVWLLACPPLSSHHPISPHHHSMATSRLQAS